MDTLLSAGDTHFDRRVDRIQNILAAFEPRANCTHEGNIEFGVSSRGFPRTDLEMNEFPVAISLSYDSACASLKVSHITKADRQNERATWVAKVRLIVVVFDVAVDVTRVAGERFNIYLVKLY